MVTAMPSEAFSQAARDKEIEFDIPAKPLAAALQHYGVASGVEVFYDGSLALGQGSASVRGRFTALDGLRELLRGTSYLPRETGIPNTLTIVPGPAVDTLRASFARYQPYFADIQEWLSTAHCLDDTAATTGTAIRFQLWLDRSGNVSQAKVLGRDRAIPIYQRFEQRMRGLNIGKAPPNGLPQPVTMVAYPPSAEDIAACSEIKSSQGGR